MAKVPYIEEGRLRHLLKVAAISGESPLRDVVLLMTVYGTGMMLTEIARLPVRAYLNGDGSVWGKSSVDAGIAYNGKERPIHWSNVKVVNAIDAYLAYRAAHDEETTLMATAFRGLNPGGPLFLTGEGAFTVRFKTAAALAELDARVAAGIGTSRNEVILKLVAAKAKEMLK